MFAKFIFRGDIDWLTSKVKEQPDAPSCGCRATWGYPTPASPDGNHAPTPAPTRTEQRSHRGNQSGPAATSTCSSPWPSGMRTAAPAAAVST